jgi:UTP-glucose-1-phosphate uridylyltransferase
VKKITLADITVDQLVDRFAEIGIAQYPAVMGGATREFKRLFDQMNAVDTEFRARGQDARLALLRLYDRPNIQVRLKAAKRTLGVALEAARNVVQAIYDSEWYPQAGEAGMTLSNLDSGFFKPD